MWLDDKDTLELATHEVYEPFETGIFKREIRPGNTVLDIGANIGYYTLIAARLVGPRGKVYAFEPDPTNFRILQKNVETNGYTNVVLVNKAVSNKNGKIRLYLNPANRGDHRVYDSKDGRPSLEIEVIALDRFFKPLDKKIHFIKMDIQGAEASAFEGMKGLIRGNKGLKLVTEFSPASLKLAGSRPESYLKSLKSMGFSLLEISEKKKSIQPVKPAQLLKRPWGGSEDYTNLFCSKK
jgi:FkbM family methyltransferase